MCMKSKDYCRNEQYAEFLNAKWSKETCSNVEQNKQYCRAEVPVFHLEIYQNFYFELALEGR